jgi:hypothetical protein
LDITEGGKKKRSLFSQEHTLWKSDRSSRQSPAVLPFSCHLPTTFTDESRTRPLPPSYRVSFQGIPALYVESVYSLAVIVNKSRAIKLWKQIKSSVRYPLPILTR